MYVEAYPAPASPAELTGSQVASLFQRLENQIAQLDDRLRRLEGKHSLAEEQAEDFEAMASKLASRETDTMAMLRIEAENQQRSREAYLDMCGLSEESDAGLKRFAMAVRDLDNCGRRNLMALVVATVEHECDGDPKWRDILAAWPMLSELVQSTLVADAESRAVEAQRAA